MTRLAELLGALSLTTDLAAGVPLETSLRTTVLAATLAESAGFDAGARRAAYFGTLLRHVGCTAWAHEAAEIAAGDDHDLLRTFEGTEPTDRLGVVARALGRLARDAGPLARVVAVGRALGRPGAGAALADAQCDQAQALAADLGFEDDVRGVLAQIYERWDGEGRLGLAGTAVDAGARTLHVAQVLEVHTRRAGFDAALGEVRRRAGRHLDPTLAALTLERRDVLAAALADDDLWERFLAAEPTPPREANDLAPVAEAFGRYADLKAPSRIGHSARVAALAAAAARAAGLADDDATTLGLAGHLHDLGVVAVPNGVLDRKGALSVGARESLRLHAYHGERILGRSGALTGLAALVGAHHERLDGRGYHRGVEGGRLDRSARLLAAADVAAGLARTRPDRPARTPDEVVTTLRAEARDGALCPQAIEAVLAADGHRPRKAAHPSGLTAREIEVVGHLARGATNKEIAAALGISPRTVQHHLEHVFAKVGATTRAAVALFAARNALL